MHRLGLEGILGLHRAGAGLIIEPHIPAGWPGYEVTYRYGQATYAICVRNDGPSEGDAPLDMTVDGKPVPGNLLALRDDGEVHQVQIALRGKRFSINPERYKSSSPCGSAAARSMHLSPP